VIINLWRVKYNKKRSYAFLNLMLLETIRYKNTF
jgi:hypothetical protein